MKNRYLLQDAIGLIDDTIITEAGNISAIKKSVKIRRHLTCAASLLLIFALLIPIASHLFTQNTYTPYMLNALEDPLHVNGKQSATIRGDGSPIGSNGSPPAFEFNLTGFCVKTEIVEILPDTYSTFQTHVTASKNTYRLIRFRTLDVINGKNIPETFLYRIPESKLVDLSYDCFYMSISQLATERYVMYNETKACLERFDEILFYDNFPELGNIIAFTDGIFDESLWQNKSWLYGYQFARYMLDEENEQLYVTRGCTEAYTRAKIDSQLPLLFDRYKSPSPQYITLDTEEEKTAFDYVTDFANGVFIPQYYSSTNVIYRRFINGIPTDETISFDFEKNEVEYSESRYTETDLQALENVALRIAEREEAYKQSFPEPKRIDTEGKKLYTLKVFGWYVKKDGTVYGVVQTRWTYSTKETIWTYHYVDEAFTVYDAKRKKEMELSRKKLIALVGENDYIYPYEYGEKRGQPLY